MNIKGEEGDHLYRAAQLQVQLDQSADRSPLQQVEEETLARPTTGVDTGEGRPGQWTAWGMEANVEDLCKV